MDLGKATRHHSASVAPFENGRGIQGLASEVTQVQFSEDSMDEHVATAAGAELCSSMKAQASCVSCPQTQLLPGHRGKSMDTEEGAAGSLLGDICGTYCGLSPLTAIKLPEAPCPGPLLQEAHWPHSPTSQPNWSSAGLRQPFEAQ